MRAIDRIRKYWTVIPPVRLKRQPGFNGISITPLHAEKTVLMPRYEDDIVSITPIHEEESKPNIVRAWGDLLADEVN